MFDQFKKGDILKRWCYFDGGITAVRIILIGKTLCGALQQLAEQGCQMVHFYFQTLNFGIFWKALAWNFYTPIL
jgi:hypothetical protein